MLPNMAMTFLRWTNGSANESGVSSSMAGVAEDDLAEVGVDTHVSVFNQTLTLHPQAIPWYALNKTG